MMMQMQVLIYFIALLIFIHFLIQTDNDYCINITSANSSVHQFLPYFNFITNAFYIKSFSILLLYIQHEHELIRTLPTLALSEHVV